MSADNAKALVAKVMSDEKLAMEINEAKSEQEFQQVISKLGYSDVSAVEFAEAFKAQKVELSNDQLDQVAGGLTLVGVDYAFTVSQMMKG